MADVTTPNTPPSCLFVGGIHAGGDGYPNAQQTLRLLEKHLGIRCIECGSWLPENAALWRLAQKGPVMLAWHGAKLAWLNLVSVARTLSRARPATSWVYVPYPATFFLWWLSWVPRRWRPKIIADAYISLWDSLIRDRGQNMPRIGAVIRAIEGRALRIADHVLTDTRANEKYYVNGFGLDPVKVHSLPLAIREDRFLSLPEKPARAGMPLTVLFVGTMIPLHGVDILLEAIRQLDENGGVHYRLIGDGQQGNMVARFLAASARRDVSWVRDWQPLDRLAQEVGRADICLGIFGGTPKSERVLPFKIYMYLAAGKPIINQAIYSVPDGLPPPPMLTVAPANPDALAAAIRTLASDAGLRTRLSREARDYFRKHLSSAAILRHWRALLGRQADGE